MKQYVIDELRPDDNDRLQEYLERRFSADQLGGIYWVRLEDELLNEIQMAHGDCQPFHFAIELSPDQLACELLVRTHNTVRCACIGYATDKQRDWLIRTIDRIFSELGMKT